MERMIRVVRANGDEVARYRIGLFHFRPLSRLDFAEAAAERLRHDKIVCEDEISSLDYEVMEQFHHG